MPSDAEVIHALRSDVAHQIARYTKQLGMSQLLAARKLDVPQPTLSKIVNNRTSDLSLELLLRIAVRAGMRLTLQTGLNSTEAGAFSSGVKHTSRRTRQSPNADRVHALLKDSFRQWSPSQRLEAFLEHSQLLAELHSAGRAARRTPDNR
jgi:predicted XRE-type DNA-binding protein